MAWLLAVKAQTLSDTFLSGRTRAKTGIKDHRVAGVGGRCRACGGLVCVQERRLCRGRITAGTIVAEHIQMSFLLQILVYILEIFAPAFKVGRPRLIASVCGYVG